MTILKESNCSTSLPDSEGIFAVGNPFVAARLKAKLKDHQEVKNRAEVFYPGLYDPLGLNFFLKTGLFHWIGSATIIDVHKTVWEKHRDLLESYEDYGYCTVIHGITEAEISQYPTASYHVFDRLPLPNGVTSNPGDAFGGNSGTKKVAYS
mmetsp:Transcript_1610/g.1695  ORF Transcript_1610/g.1695 Transcript_1610/m.1695 type:complete len:151 (+) Transcript_1610:936-1388(+)